jgi:UDP-3-O-[3-hydroxymyristoyl] glucosamine N-acyltransferase
MLNNNEGFTAAEVAAYVGGTVKGNPEVRLAGFKPLDVATENDLSFLHRRRYRKAALASHAGAIIAKHGTEIGVRTVIFVEDASLAYRSAIDLFYPPRPRVEGISAQAVIDDTAQLASGVYVGTGAIVGRLAVLGECVTVMSGAVIGEECIIGKNSIIHPGAVLYPGVIVGERVVIHANAVIGREGFGFHRLPNGRLQRVRQVGTVILEDDVEIGACTCVDRATLTQTRVGAGSKLDNLVIVGHNVQIEEDCLVIGQTGIAGSTRIGRGSGLYGQVTINGHITLGERTTVLLRGCVIESTPPGSTFAGYPAMPASRWRRVVALTKRLPELLRGRTGTKSDVEADSLE